MLDKYPTIKFQVMTFEDVKMKADASEDDEKNGVIICETQAQLEGALRNKCQEQWKMG